LADRRRSGRAQGGAVMLENGKIRFSRCKKFKAVKADYGYRSIIVLFCAWLVDPSEIVHG